jgi:membrane protease YdiL (CAAX protease family)
MMSRRLASWFPQAPPGHRRVASLVIVSAIMVALHSYFGSQAFAERVLEKSSINPPYYLFITTFVLFGLLPACYLRLIRQESLREYGVRIGEWRSGLFSVAILLPIIFIVILYPGSLTEGLRSHYPLDRTIGSSWGRFVGFELVRGVLFYSAWEFFYRGVMLFALRKEVGDWPAIAIQMLPSAIWHFGLPASETIAAIPGGILFGLIALKTNSILYPLLLHYLIGVGLDFLIVVQ